MTVEVKLFEQRCNLRCTYCYQQYMRAVEKPRPYDLKKIEQSLLKQNRVFTVYGGEALLAPIADLEELWKFSYEHWGHGGVQTNGTLITEAHVELFKRYRVEVGFSIDGPGDCNKARSSPKLTEATMGWLHRLLDEKLNPSVIATLHRLNANDQFIDWMHDLDRRGMRWFNLHLLENDSSDSIKLPESEQIAFLRRLYEQKFDHMTQALFKEMRGQYWEGKGGSCVWNGCDPYNTQAVQGIWPNGELHNCGRIAKEGVDWIKSNSHTSMRDDILLSTPQESGGCQGCRYFFACRGFCPGTGIDGDWRNRTEHCESLKKIFSWIEEDGICVSVEP